MRPLLIALLFSAFAFASINAMAQDGYGDPWADKDQSLFGSPNDDWSKTFNDSTSSDDRIKTDKPKKNNQLDNTWQSPRKKRQSIGDIHSKQFQTIDD